MKVDAKGLAAGDEFLLTLESFNSLSIAQSALKTDYITIKVLPAAAPVLSQLPQMQFLTASEPSSWTLPEIKLGTYELDRIEFKASANIAPALTFDQPSLQVKFNGSIRILPGTNGLVCTIQFDLIDIHGFSNSYTQTLLVKESTLIPQNEEP